MKKKEIERVLIVEVEDKDKEDSLEGGIHKVGKDTVDKDKEDRD